MLAVVTLFSCKKESESFTLGDGSLQNVDATELGTQDLRINDIQNQPYGTSMAWNELIGLKGTWRVLMHGYSDTANPLQRIEFVQGNGLIISMQMIRTYGMSFFRFDSNGEPISVKVRTPFNAKFGVKLTFEKL